MSKHKKWGSGIARLSGYPTLAAMKKNDSTPMARTRMVVSTGNNFRFSWHQPAIIPVLLLVLGSLVNCAPDKKISGYLLLYTDTLTNQQGYKNQNGDLVIPPGKYEFCFTDTFKNYAIVLLPGNGFAAIDKQENILYEVFPYDNGPDYPSEGLFRIVSEQKIGYADGATGKVVIKPQFDCAWPFENGRARVSNVCETQIDGEHTLWNSDHWFYIDKTGKKN